MSGENRLEGKVKVDQRSGKDGSEDGSLHRSSGEGVTLMADKTS